MTSLWRGVMRRSKGSIVTRSSLKSCVAPPWEMRGATRVISVSNAADQSSSVPSSSPIRWLGISSHEAWQMMGDLALPRGPVVRDVVAPQVELVPDPLPREDAGESLRALQRAGRVLPHALAADEQEADLRAQPLQVVAVQVVDVVERIVEVRLDPALAAARHRDVVDARHGDGDREEVGAAKREVRGVVGAERGARQQDLLRTAAVLVDERRDLVDEPVLVAAVKARGLLELGAAEPRARVIRGDAVDLHATGVDQTADRADHPVRLPVADVALLGRERDQRAPPVAVDEHVAVQVERR